MTLDRFLSQFWRDVDQGRVRPLEEYQSEYPGLAKEIAREYDSSAPHESPDTPPALGDDESTTVAAPTTADGDTRGGAPRAVGRYQILGPLQAGGSGSLLRARDPAPDREVVVKPLRAHAALDPPAIDRLERETRIVNALEHPGICPVLDVISEHDRLFVVTPLLEGETLAEHMTAFGDTHQPEAIWARLGTADEAEGGGAGLPAMLRMMESIARTVHTAHEAGILHRDLKPTNILLSAGSQPVVLNFGLAIEVDSDQPAMSQAGQTLDSPTYMAPEQIEGGATEIDRRTDVYALGVILYELLTGSRPFDGRTVTSLTADILRGEPEAPRRRNPNLAPDLEAVCLRAMARDPTRRYATAEMFAQDMGNVRMLRATIARPEAGERSLWRRLLRIRWPWSRQDRHRSGGG